MDSAKTPENNRQPLIERNSRSVRRGETRWQNATSAANENAQPDFLQGRDEKEQATLMDLNEGMRKFSTSIIEEIRKVGTQVESVAHTANAAKAAAVAAELSVAALEGELQTVRGQVQHLQENLGAQVRGLVQLEIGKRPPPSRAVRRWGDRKPDNTDGWENFHNNTDSDEVAEKMAREVAITGYERHTSRKEIQGDMEKRLRKWGGSEEAAFAPRAVGSIGIYS